MSDSARRHGPPTDVPGSASRSDWPHWARSWRHRGHARERRGRRPATAPASSAWTRATRTPRST